MENKDSLSRRRFLARSSGALLAAAAIDGVATHGQSPVADAKLALKGGPKAVETAPVHGIRWGEPERKQLDAMLQQGSLFYWKGPQTKLLIERFQKVCPLKYVQTCSSGTAALHIAVAACGIGMGDEVITSPMTDIGTVIGVIYQQGVPVFADLGRGHLQPRRGRRRAADHAQDQGHHRRPPDAATLATWMP